MGVEARAEGGTDSGVGSESDGTKRVRVREVCWDKGGVELARGGCGGGDECARSERHMVVG